VNTTYIIIIITSRSDAVAGTGRPTYAVIKLRLWKVLL